MAQSESEDFEFKTSDLEVEGEKSATPENGEGVAQQSEASEAPTPSDSAGQQELANDESESETGSEAGPRRPQTPSMRPLGEDDLGAEAFAEAGIEDEAMTFEDAIEGLFKEVDTYQTGGGDEADFADETADLAASETGEFLDLEDPDDSVAAKSASLPQEVLDAMEEAYNEVNDEVATHSQEGPQARGEATSPPSSPQQAASSEKPQERQFSTASSMPPQAQAAQNPEPPPQQPITPQAEPTSNARSAQPTGAPSVQPQAQPTTPISETPIHPSAEQAAPPTSQSAPDPQSAAPAQPQEPQASTPSPATDESINEAIEPKLSNSGSPDPIEPAVPENQSVVEEPLQSIEPEITDPVENSKVEASEQPIQNEAQPSSQAEPIEPQPESSSEASPLGNREEDAVELAPESHEPIASDDADDQIDRSNVVEEPKQESGSDVIASEINPESEYDTLYEEGSESSDTTSEDAKVEEGLEAFDGGLEEPSPQEEAPVEEETPVAEELEGEEEDSVEDVSEDGMALELFIDDDSKVVESPSGEDDAQGPSDSQEEPLEPTEEPLAETDEALPEEFDLQPDLEPEEVQTNELDGANQDEGEALEEETDLLEEDPLSGIEEVFSSLEETSNEEDEAAEPESDLAPDAVEKPEDESEPELEALEDLVEEPELEPIEDKLEMPTDENGTEEFAEEPVVGEEMTSPGLSEVSEEGEKEEAEAEVEPAEAANAQSADDLLVQAGNVLNEEELTKEAVLGDDAEASGESAEDEPIEGTATAIPGLTEVPDDEEEPTEEAVPIPSSEDLLMQASSLLNGEEPSEEAKSLLEEEKKEKSSDEQDDEEDLVMMPDPSSLMASAEGLSVVDDDEEEAIEAMPDPQSLIKEADQKKSGDVADRAGDLPPPPPAPVEIIDDDPLEVDPEADDASEDTFASSGGSEIDQNALDDLGIEDPFAGDASIEEFDEGIEELVAPKPEDAGETQESANEEPESKSAVAKKEEVAEVIEMPKPGLLWRVTHSLTVAAAALAIGAGWVFSVWKEEIQEYIEGRDVDGSIMVAQIRKIGAHALEGFDESGLYQMQWIDSEVRRVAQNEIRIHALVGARLKEDLYVPVLDSYLEEEYGFSEMPLFEALGYAQTHFPNEVRNFPTKPWQDLYRLSTPRSEVLPLRVVYRIAREFGYSDWEFAGAKVRGYYSDLEWPEGEPRHKFGSDAYDVDSVEFQKLLAYYRKESEVFIANLDTLRKSAEAESALLAIENRERKNRVMMSLSRGSFFDGLAILGEDADDTQSIRMVITEISEKGNMVKGVFQMGDMSDLSKHFVGRVDFVGPKEGLKEGILNVTTVAFDGESSHGSAPPFFDPSTISRIRLKTDGFRLEGDIDDLSLRMTRAL